MQTRKQDILYSVATVAWTAPCCIWQGMALKIDYPQKYAQILLASKVGEEMVAFTMVLRSILSVNNYNH